MTDEYAVDTAQIDAARTMLATLKAMLEVYSDTPISAWHHAINAAIAAAQQAGLEATEGQVRSPVIRASEHPSSERRRGLEEALEFVRSSLQRIVERKASWSYIPIDTEACSYAIQDCSEMHDIAERALSALIPPSSEGGEEKT